MHKSLTVTILLLIIAAAPLVAQESGNLEKIRKEIRDLETQLRESENREQSIQERLENLNRQIGLRRTLIEQLEAEKRSSRRTIAAIESSLQQNIAEFERRKDLVARRFVVLYKRGRQSEWEALLSLKTVNQLLVWMKYQSMVIDNDKRNMRILLDQKEEILAQREARQRELTRSEALIAEAAKEERSLRQNRSRESDLLTAVRADQQSLQEKIREKQAALNRIKKWMASSEKTRKQAAYAEIDSDFEHLRGRLDWPVKGTVVSRYGNYTNRTFNVDEENYGIDIEATGEATVVSVCKGRVLRVDWIRGLGNIVIIDHGKGYTTLYGYLNVVLVNEGDLIEAGREIGRLGSSDSLYGSNLHFQVWHEKSHQNPQRWLKAGP
ncbi:peptidoglycan DD-metalloendopeptidase family protein [bacterium]|nr:peptidoglycan DD-metalloendopeptidase family protein [bacterium]